MYLYLNLSAKDRSYAVERGKVVTRAIASKLLNVFKETILSNTGR
jgi:hypothetical protein